MDYICDLNADLYAMTETWLTENDASVRVELIPDGYNLLDQHRVGRRIRSTFQREFVDIRGL